MSLRRHVYIDARRCSWALALAMTTLTAAPVAISCDSAKTRTPLTRAPAPPRTNNTIAPTGLQLVRWYVPLDPAIRRDGIARLIELKLATRVESPLASNGITLLRVKPRRPTHNTRADQRVFRSCHCRAEPRHRRDDWRSS